MYKSLQYQNAEKTMICATRDDGSMVIIEPENGALWTDAVSGSLGAVQAYVQPPEPSDDEKLAAERAKMQCSPVQMRLALLAAGRLSEVHAIADNSETASIVWEYAPFISRDNALIAALGDENEFTPTEIDDLFRSAMAIKV